MVDGLESRWAGRVEVARVNVHEPEGERFLARLRGGDGGPARSPSGVIGTPTFLLFDPSGRVVWSKRGGLPDEGELEARIRAIESTPR